MSASVKAAKPKALCLRNPEWVGDDFLDKFREKFELHVIDVPDRTEWFLNIDQKVKQDGPFQAMMIRMGTHPYGNFDRDFFAPLLPDLKIIASASAGYDEFSVDWMTSQNIWFCNTVDAVSEATADMAIFLMLAAIRDTTRAEKAARESRWRADHVPSRDPAGMKLGIIGMGAIGKHIARKASVFNLDIQYHNRRRLSEADEATYHAKYCQTMQLLLETSDIVSISVPLNAETTGMIGVGEFAAMKDSSILINTSRGAVIDEQALVNALESGKIWRAGLDVFCGEPKIHDYFRKSEKVIIQPHMGGLTQMSFRKAERECLENIRAFFETERPVAPVNELSAWKAYSG
ncbi:putative 2-hydroxyacid dehydrogenase [Lasiodiplodia theobromae]|uniref:Putative 2-hydroxyacid dehydrogenase n=1 Tax=Lasiodiplodia theobromae TaxID=45133 RepID=A0A5N5DHP0_9PEZI|nr:putative 2-hydroxyacid dehydrogenase [Lasiodiplodia theobromae]